jgi:hypothetical protein
MPQDDSPSAPEPARFSVLNPLAVADWDRQLLLLPGAGFFHSSAWARVLHDTYGFQPMYQAVIESGRIRALLPLMEVDSWLTGRRGIALPFTDLVEPPCADADTFRQLFDGALALAKTREWKYFECRGGKKWLPDVPASTTFLRHTLDLGLGEPALFASFEDSVRRAVRKAERGNLQLEFSQSAESMQAFYHLLCRTRRRHGVPPQPYSFFANIQRHVLAGNQGWIVLARQGQIPVAGGIFFHFGRHAIYKFGASDETQQQLRANNLVMWRSIQHYTREGFTSFDFGRTSLTNEGLRKFKLGWGTQEETVEYVRHDGRSSTFVTARDEAQGWYNRVFRALPMALSRLAGTALYRHIA